MIRTDVQPAWCAAAEPTGYRPPWEHTLGNPWGRFPQDRRRTARGPLPCGREGATGSTAAGPPQLGISAGRRPG
ncbi:hypothetical protein [Isoptericola sp. AK164]|uniref:hypothetical protein n=1 Tax=Isoptericola sp. AK164 TaxID=3024246 RepID=UPI0024184444|nr:hypothetical protein [Isoptericola sp. AK164]